MVDDQPSSIHSKNLTGITRRRLMKALSSAGFGTFAIAQLTPEDVRAASSDQVPIPVAIEEDETKMVPADWYDNLQHATDVFYRNNFPKKNGVIGQWIAPGKVGSRNTRITVEIEAGNERARGRVPAEKDGVPIDIREVRRRENGGCYRGTDFGISVPGGAQVSASNVSGYFTGGPRLVHKNDSDFEGWGTCQHGFNSCKENTIGKGLTQPAGGEVIGTVKDASDDADFAAIQQNPFSNHYPQSKIVKPSGKSNYWEITNSFTREYICDLARRGENVQKMGCRTCLTSGVVKECHGYVIDNYACGAQYEQVQWGTANDFNDGDSGSPVFTKGSDNRDWGVTSLGNGVSYSLSSGYVYGGSIYSVYNQLGYYFSST